MKQYCPKCKNWRNSTECICPICGNIMLSQGDNESNQNPNNHETYIAPTFVNNKANNVAQKSSSSGKDIKKGKIAVISTVCVLVAAIVTAVIALNLNSKELTESSNSSATTYSSTYSSSYKSTNIKSSSQTAYESLTVSQKKTICNYIQNQYDYYDRLEGRNTGDKYSDIIWQKVMDKYGLEEWQVTSIWSNYYSY